LRSFVACIGCVLAALCLLAQPASASMAADFNGDGVLDRFLISPAVDTRVVVHVSGSDPQVLKTRGRLVSIVAVDVDRDGHLDLSALSEHRGIIIWLNKGGTGHFSVLKKQRHTRRSHTISREHRASASERGQESAPAQTGADGSVGIVHPESASSAFALTLHARVLPPRVFATASGLNASTGSRAPPTAG
jgi:hypothetical protein